MVVLKSNLHPDRRRRTTALWQRRAPPETRPRIGAYGTVDETKPPALCMCGCICRMRAISMRCWSDPETIC